MNKDEILVIDDDPAFCRLAEELLKENGFKVRVASGASEALERIRERVPDLILLDLVMPDMSGIDLCRILRENPRTTLTPILLISGMSELSDRIKCYQAGVDDFITKPFDVEDLVVRVINRLQRNREFRSLAEIDALTGAYNRRALNDKLAEMIRLAGRYSRELSLAILDLDRFKSINDTYGHLVGDIILKDLVSLMQERLRNVDILTRYGGEEFAVIMPETTKQGAFVAMNRLRNQIADHKFIYRPEALEILITVSVGISVFPEAGKTPAQLLEAADKALYVAKDAGRNKVRVFTPGGTQPKWTEPDCES